ncbi:MAG: PAS domain S-box protein [Polyangiaceae bacterium]
MTRAIAKDKPWLGDEPPSVDFLAAIIDNVARPIFVKNRRFEFVLLNRAFADMAGHERDDMLGKTNYDFFATEEADFFRRKDMEMFSQEATVVIDEEPLTDSSGERHILATTKVPYRDETGRVTHLFGIISDITKIKLAEETLRDANEELERRVLERTAALADAQEELIRKERLAVLGQLAGGVAHQLRNPLGAIQNAAALLRHGPLDDEQAEVLGMIDEEVARADRTISALLDYARVRPPQARRVTMVDLVEEVLDQELVPESIELSIVASPTLEATIDSAQVQIALGNVVRNAVEAMPDGGRLSVKVLLVDDRVEVTVRDTGDGVLPDVVARLFEPLVTTKVDGSGLGLCTARNLIENQGGRIGYRPAKSGGACFVVELPS